MRKYIEYKNRKNEAGYITLAVMTMVALATIVASSIMDKQIQTKQLLSAGRRDSQVYYLQQRVISAIYNNEAWNSQTALNNCMKDGTSCTNPETPSALKLKDSSGAVLNDSTDAEFGYTWLGAPCTSFDGTDGNDDCPLRINMTWTPTLCDAGKCLIRVQGTFVFKPKSPNIIMNPTRYDFNIVRGREEGSLQEACNSLRGNFQQGTSACSVAPSSALTCPQGQYMIRSRNSGIIQCRTSYASAADCPDGSAAIGFKENGQLDCRSILDWK